MCPFLSAKRCPLSLFFSADLPRGSEGMAKIHLRSYPSRLFKLCSLSPHTYVTLRSSTTDFGLDIDNLSGYRPISSQQKAIQKEGGKDRRYIRRLPTVWQKEMSTCSKLSLDPQEDTRRWSSWVAWHMWTKCVTHVIFWDEEELRFVFFGGSTENAWQLSFGSCFRVEMVF